MTSETPFLRLQARTQRFTLGAPREFRVTPDGSRVLFLRASSGEENRTSLWSLDVGTGVESVLVDAAALTGTDERLSEEERARRERSRERSGGVVGYACDAEVRKATFALSGRLYVVDTLSGELAELATNGSVVDPRLDPTGSHVAYVADRGLRVVDLATGADRALSEPGNEQVAWGLAEFIAAEEMNRARGYWWSPDGTALLVERSDRGPVTRWHIADAAQPDREPTAMAYPAAGTPNAVVSLVLLGLDGSNVPIDWDAERFPYLVEVHWSAGGPPLIAVQSRDQRTIQIRSVDLASGATALRFTRTDPTWVEIIPGAPAWTSDGRLVVVSEQDSSYRLLIEGEPVTGPGLQVRSVLRVTDEVLFTGSEDDPTQIHVYRTSKGETQRLSTAAGVHIGGGDAALTVLSSWSLDYHGPRVEVLRDGAPVAKIDSLVADPGLPLNLSMLTVGSRRLRCALLLPNGYQRGAAKLPVLLDPYGGPHAQRVLRSSSAFLTAQWLADQGFAVLVVDGRGSPGRGPAWDREIAGELADVPLADQVDALQAVAEEYPDVLDTERVAIRGWSFGGFLAALAVLRRPDVFHAAVAGAPVTDWRLYDTHYTERYLGLPDDDPASFTRNSLLADADGLRRPLMLIHGLADDNVFPAHALRLSAALFNAGKSHYFVPLVGATHMPPNGEAGAESLVRQQVDWLLRELNVSGSTATPTEMGAGG
ncbi:dipeptidyl-peptidase-4 [Tamaricihabitans halophyticus]|uniref:Dipeptidyl-peptidase-4 n=1 Tax=Tamaricihabitans halophyticus TaxID=1262583 RepID=A0A4R2R1C0_9PSEU|nr:S9 family peptidase [Tamaricihabitans halophyticus]TCP55288.1 dipeptidyl-peptidase-4 [Tamaricihabitans halophyticus]